MKKCPVKSHKKWIKFIGKTHLFPKRSPILISTEVDFLFKAFQNDE